ncbi:hypothetical protein C8F01DRAFT_1150010 [Mycena amicta]|nr:hypothetical protein C8F01DRAFT_1150010 [Mycena amicta]
MTVSKSSTGTQLSLLSFPLCSRRRQLTMATGTMPGATSRQHLMNVTAESLVTWVGVLEPGKGDYTEQRRCQPLGAQLGLLQQRPKPLQMRVYSEVAAKYLPELVNLWRERPQATNSVTELINEISSIVYFARFMRTPAGAGLVGLQAKRVAADFDIVSALSIDEIATVGQFLSTLLVLQGDDEVEEEDKRILLQRLPEWFEKYQGRLASEVADRCMGIFRKDPLMVIMAEGVKRMITVPLEHCGKPGCKQTMRKDGTGLLQCSRCKCAVYCSIEHQKAEWAQHKPFCFSSMF